MTAPNIPEVIVESSGLFPPLSGVGYYTRELLKAYAALPDHYPIKILAYRFFLKSRPSPQEDYLVQLSRSLDGTLEVHHRLVPGQVYAWLRRIGLRPPIPLDLFELPGSRLYFFPNYVGEPLLSGSCIPVIYDFGFMRYHNTLQGRDDLYLKRYLPRTLRRAPQVVVISDYVSKELQQAYGVPAERITTVYPAVDHSRFRPDIPPQALQAARHRYGLEPGYIFCLGTFEPRKNFPRLIEAYALLPDDLKSRVTLVIAGGPGWKSQDIPETIRRLGLTSRIRLLGYIADADRAPLMREAALFALPSLHEGFGMPVLESLACGTPVVTSAHGALPEVAGKAALYVDPLRPEDIARGLQSVLKNPGLKTKLSAEGLRRAAAFRWEFSARVLAGVFQKAGAVASRPTVR
jgi:glycosyltransferase involved in cell wall biosynthesis